MKKAMIIISVLFFTILSCQKKECNCEIDPKVQIENDSILNLIINDSIYVDSAVTKTHWMKYYWDRFEEPILLSYENEVYRFSIVVLLYDYFKVYRVEKVKDEYKLYVKEYAVSTTTSFRQDSLVNSFSKNISKKDWQSITNAVEENCFWTMPINEKKQYLDGASWVFEGFKNNNNCTESNYHWVSRTSPDSSSFKNICDKIIGLDSLDVKNFLYPEEDY